MMRKRDVIESVMLKVQVLWSAECYLLVGQPVRFIQSYQICFISQSMLLTCRSGDALGLTAVR